MNGGRPGWSITDHLLADVWRLLVQVNSDDPKKVDDHPVRAEMIERAEAAEKSERRGALMARWRQLKSKYGNRIGG